MIKKKLAAKRGFTLTELLVTIAILSLLGVSVGLGISVAGRAYSGVTRSSEASVLSGTLAVELADELRFAENISMNGGTVTFTSRRFGTNVSVGGSGGRVTVGGNQILAEKAYTGLNAAAAVSYSDGLFTVTISVTSPGGSVLRDATFIVAPISG